MRTTGACLATLLALGCGCGSPAPSPEEELEAIFEESWQFQLRESPLFATAVGVHEYDDRLPSMTLEDIQRRALYWQQVEARLGALEAQPLSDEALLNLGIFSQQVQDRIESHRFHEFLIPITAESGFHTRFARLPERIPLATTEDYENYLARLEAYAIYTDQNIELMREGIANGFVLPRVTLDGYDSTIRPHIVDRAQESVFWVPFDNFPVSVAEADRERLREAGLEAIRDTVVPAYRRLLDFMLGEYIPACRATVGASELPDGDAYYAFLVRHHTTLDVTPEEVHSIGLAEVERIRGEMLAIIDALGFEGDLAEFLDFLRTDPQFFVDSPRELLEEASYIAKKMDGKLPSLFKTLPRLPYGIEPVPEHIAPKYTAGRYIGAPLGSTKAGYYWVNTYALESRPLWALPALTLHEAVPGHHLQNALRQELTELPNFRRFSGVNAYGEGWALYSEWLGVEAGIYESPYENFGRLTYEMWRACRLVVDTGLHAMGWSRRQAMDFMAANTALSQHEITTETDRYISSPGQALAYKMGQIRIMELRRRAEEELGTAFDVRELHDVILRSGPVPLTVLEKRVDAFIERARTGSD